VVGLGYELVMEDYETPSVLAVFLVYSGDANDGTTNSGT
jgi:hypothetical protein